MSSAEICLVTLGHDALDDRIFYKEALSLKKSYPRVTVLAPGHIGQQVVEGIRVVTIPPRRFLWRTLWSLWLAARRERAQCYHLHEPLLLPLAVLLKWCYHARIIYDVHEHLPEMIADFSTRSRPVVFLLVAFFSLVEQRLVRIADAVVVTSAELARRCSRWNRRVVSIYNYPRRDLFTTVCVPEEMQQRYGSSRVVMYHGQLSRARAIPVLLRAVKQAAQRIADIKLILLGPVFGDGYRAELISMLQEEGAGEMVELLDPVPHPQVPSYLSLCEVGLVVLPDRSVFKHALPIKLLEYMSCGVPVVGSRGLPATEDIVRETGCGLLVEPDDVEALAKAIVFLLDHRESAEEMGRRGQHAIEEKYNWERMESRLLEIYQNVMREKN